MSLRRPLILLVFLPIAAHGDDGWTTYRAATAAAEAKAWAGALPLYRQALAEATEPALRQATCFGIGLTALELVQAGGDRALACEGEEAFGCFLGLDHADPQAVALAEQGRLRLGEQCRATPPPPPDQTLSWLMLGTGGALAVGGGVLVGLAFSDAALVRDRQRQGTADLEAQAELELGLGYGLLGLGLAAAGVALFALPDGLALTAQPGGLGLVGWF